MQMIDYEDFKKGLFEYFVDKYKNNYLRQRRNHEEK